MVYFKKFEIIFSTIFDKNAYFRHKSALENYRKTHDNSPEDEHLSDIKLNLLARKVPKTSFDIKKNTSVVYMMIPVLLFQESNGEY